MNHNGSKETPGISIQLAIVTVVQTYLISQTADVVAKYWGAINETHTGVSFSWITMDSIKVKENHNIPK